MSINFVLIGHVDHGKTTCAGRILIDTGTVSEQDAKNVMKEAEQNKMKSWWLAYLLDIDEERERGKTHEYEIIEIDYKDKKLNLIDVPGHKQFVNQMILGAMQANVAVLICSAKKGEIDSGIKGQTYEHLMLVKSIGVKHLIVAVNKMDHDTVNWDMGIYDNIQKKLGGILKKLNFKTVRFVPISAYEGTNIVKSTDKSLMDLISESKIEKINDKPIFNSDKVEAKIMFMNIKNIITSGFECVLHSGNNITDCIIDKIIHKVPFVCNRDKTPIKVSLKLDREIDIYDRIILRDGDITIGIGIVVM